MKTLEYYKAALGEAELLLLQQQLQPPSIQSTPRIISVLGAAGSGKTTLLAWLACFYGYEPGKNATVTWFTQEDRADTINSRFGRLAPEFKFVLRLIDDAQPSQQRVEEALGSDVIVVDCPSMGPEALSKLHHHLSYWITRSRCKAVLTSLSLKPASDDQLSEAIETTAVLYADCVYSLRDSAGEDHKTLKLMKSRHAAHEPFTFRQVPELIFDLLKS